MVFRRSLINETRWCKMHGPKVSNKINIMSGPRRVEIKVVNQGDRWNQDLNQPCWAFHSLFCWTSLSLTFRRDFCKRVNSPTFFNLVLIFSSPQANIDRHLFVVLWAFSLTVMGEQTERAVGKELGQLVGTNPITVSHQHAQIKGQYWPPCPFGGHVGARIKHFSSLRIVDHPIQVSWQMGVVAGCSWADENCYQQ